MANANCRTPTAGVPPSDVLIPSHGSGPMDRPPGTVCSRVAGGAAKLRARRAAGRQSGINNTDPRRGETTLSLPRHRKRSAPVQLNTQNEYDNTQLRYVPEMDQTCFGDRFLLRIIRTYIPEANATLAVVGLYLGHDPHQKRERHKHDAHMPILNGSAPRTRSTRSTDTCSHARYIHVHVHVQ